MENICILIEKRTCQLEKSKKEFLIDGDINSYNQMWSRVEELKSLKKEIEKLKSYK